MKIRRIAIFNSFCLGKKRPWRNCVNSHGISFLKNMYSNNEANDKIKGMKLNEIHELLFENGINLNDVETYKKRV